MPLAALYSSGLVLTIKPITWTSELHYVLRNGRIFDRTKVCILIAYHPYMLHTRDQFTQFVCMQLPTCTIRAFRSHDSFLPPNDLWSVIKYI